MGNEIRVSYSWKYDYDWCPRRFKYKRVEKVEPDLPPPSYNLEGQALHRVFKGVYEAQNFTFDYAYSLLKPALVEVRKECGLDVEKEFSLSKVSVKTLENFITMVHKYNIDVPALLSEKEMVFVLTSPKSGNNYRITSVLDLAVVPKGEQSPIIVDFKTGSYIPTEYEIQENDQATIYYMATKVVLNLDVSRFVFMFPKKKKWIETRRTSVDYEKLIHALDVQVLKVKNKEFNPTYKNCQMCQYPEKCRKEDVPKLYPGIDSSWMICM